MVVQKLKAVCRWTFNLIKYILSYSKYMLKMNHIQDRNVTLYAFLHKRCYRETLWYRIIIEQVII